VKVSHILYKLGQHSKEEGEKLAQNARAKILAGEDFGVFAMKFSEDGSAMNKGELDWMGRAELDPAFADAAFALKKPGDISEPVLSQFGWHLIKLEDRRAAGTRPYEEVREQILAEMKKAYVDEKKAALLNSINEDPTGKVNTAAVDALYIEPAPAPAMPRSGTPRKAKAAKPDKDADSAAAEYSKKITERAKRRAARAGTEAEPAKN
jgi:parvulin-like peptidyl-prolyl isomerase